jgi:hypothetical protein
MPWLCLGFRFDSVATWTNKLVPSWWLFNNWTHSKSPETNLSSTLLHTTIENELMKWMSWFVKNKVHLNDLILNKFLHATLIECTSIEFELRKLNWIQIKFNWVSIELNWIQISKLKWIKLNTILFFLWISMVHVFIKISIELNLVELNQIQWYQTNLNSIEIKLNSTWFHLNYFHNFVELNSTKLWKFNYENVNVNLSLHIHVGGLMKDVK